MSIIAFLTAALPVFGLVVGHILKYLDEKKQAAKLPENKIAEELKKNEEAIYNGTAGERLDNQLNRMQSSAKKESP